jgi:hypothetical protein
LTSPFPLVPFFGFPKLRDEVSRVFLPGFSYTH